MILQETKNGEIRQVALAGHALQLLKELDKVRRLDTQLLFPGKYPKKPIVIRSAWEKAVSNAEIQDLRFHDLRHSCASYLAMNGASLAEIAEEPRPQNLGDGKALCTHIRFAYSGCSIKNERKNLWVNFMNFINCPEIRPFLQRESLGMHEAAFFLLDSYPNDYELVVYSPSPSENFNPNDYGDTYREMHERLKNAILKKELDAVCETNFEVSFTVRPDDVLLWALSENISIPMNLQEEFFCQFELRQQKPYLIKIKNMLVAQFILAKEPYLKDNVEGIMGHFLMETFNRSGKCKSLKNHISENYLILLESLEDVKKIQTI